MHDFDGVDYAITHVRYVGHQIEQVRRWRIVDGDLVDPVTVSRAAVVQDIDVGIDYCTAIEADDEWVLGDDVTTYRIDGERFLRTAAGSDPEDNLSGLPEF